MKRTLLLSCLIVVGAWALAQGEQRSVSFFNKIVVHPYIDVELEPGDSPDVKVEAQGIDLEEVITENHGRTLQVYLRGARSNKIKNLQDMDINWRKYKDVKVTVSITYPALKKLSLRGETTTHLIGPTHGKKLILKLFGEQEFYAAGMALDYLKTVIYGEADIEMLAGYAYLQKWKVFGEANVDATGLEGEDGKVRVFGESEMKLNLTQHLGCTVFGESKIRYVGNPDVDNVVLGEGNVKPLISANQ